MEKELIAVSLRSRSDFALVADYIDIKGKNYSKEFQVLMAKIGEYYKRDSGAEAVAPEVLLAQLQETIRAEKLVERLREYTAEAVESLSSDANVRAVVHLAKQQEVKDQLAAALVTDVAGDKVDTLIATLTELRRNTEVAEVDEEEVLHDVDLSSLLEAEYDPANVIKLYPNSLNDRLDGGARPGHHIVVFARPEVGKSATVINISGGVARQDKRVLYIINEDRTEDIYIRHVSNLSNMTKHQVRDDPDKAKQIADDHGLGNVRVVGLSPGTPNDVRRLIDKYDPQVVIADQLRNFKVKSDNRVNQLEMAATEMRNIGKEANVLMCSVTQAGDSADGKLILDMGDVDYSNTGIPSQADLMVGIGMDAQYEAEGLRMISLPKNKIGAMHEHFPVRIYPQYSRLVSVNGSN